jgi:CheY-like chemotaxis protein
VHLDSTEGVGTTVRVLLPALPAAIAKAPRQRDLTPPPGRTTTVLIVDDEPMLRKAAARILVALGYKVLTAENGQAALDLYAVHGSEIALVILDITMPVMSGDECFRRLRALRADLPIVIASGHPKGRDLEPLLDDVRVAFLLKPYATADLTQAIAVALGVAA